MNLKTSFLCLSLCMYLSGNAAFSPVDLKVMGLDSPLGIDSQTPVFSWRTQSDERGFIQGAYEITVSNTDGETVWQSGRVDSRNQNQIAYAGAPLQSLTSYRWDLIVYDDNGNSSQKVSSTFETAFMDHAEWSARWIKSPGRVNAVVEVPVPQNGVDGRYLKIDVTKLGLPASTDAKFHFLQLAEVEIISNGKNIAPMATFTSNDTWTIGNWDIRYINDGEIGGVNLGYTTKQHDNPDQHVWITADLKETRHIERILLYPRQDDAAKSGTEAANFPSSYRIGISDDNNVFTHIFSVSDSKAPAFVNSSSTVPYIGKKFNIDPSKTIKRARIYASATGVFTMNLNGKPVTDAVLEPGESEYEKTILYSVYDVSDLVRKGDNTIIARVAGGLFNIDYLPGRYSKGEIKNSGPKCLKAELHIDYADGTSTVIPTDRSWVTAPSPTLGSNWWGGEDYDARLRIKGIDSPDYDFSGWQNAVEENNPSFKSTQASGFGTLRSRDYEPVKVAETWNAVDVKSVQSGGYQLYVVDFGKNFAGTYRFNLKGKSGQTITLREGESLNEDGSIYMQNYYTGPADTYDTYTFAGDESGEVWGPEFMYHGFRYLQIIGLEEKPAPSDFTALRERSDIDMAGKIETSNKLINDIHRICRDAIQSQLYNSVTDCPQREKLGWLDVPNEMFNSICYNYDMERFWHKVTLDCFDSQYNDGQVPSTVPHYMSVYDNDPNWGGAAILVPYRSWKWYGDRSLMIKYYDQMKRLVDYYTSVSSDGIMPGNSFSVLSDWGQETAGVNPMVPGEFTITTTYYYLLKAMQEMAEELGKPDDASTFAEQAALTKNSFNRRYYKDGIYANGRQSEQAMPLYYGLVEKGNESLVAEELAKRVIADNYKIRTGEIALKPLLVSLAEYGHNDIVYKMANQTDCPSYGYWVEQGYTTTPEYWDVGAFSQNHCMMDHIEEWFFGYLGGIKNTGIAYDKFEIAPWIPGDMNSLQSSVKTIYGEIALSYVRPDDGNVELTLSIPENSEATVLVPVGNDNAIYENGAPLEKGSNGVNELEYDNDFARVRLGSGVYNLSYKYNNSQGVPSYNPSEIGGNDVYYNLQGIRTETPAEGIHIRHSADGVQKVMIK